jgi:hypothetical protein
VRQTPPAVKIRTEASSAPSLKQKMRWSPMRRRWPRAKALQRPKRTALLPAPRRMSTGQSNLPSGRAGGVNHPPDCVRQPEGAEARGIDDDEEL